MALKLEKVIPIGRKLIEYKGMFNLDDQAIKEYKIIDCGGGPSSFNAEGTRIGGDITSIDPIYQFSARQVKSRVDETFDDMFAQVGDNKEMFVFNHIKSVEELIVYRREAIENYLADFDSGKKEGRYQFESLPKTHFESKTFDLALCSHFLFLYSEQLNLQFHVDAIEEMLRIAGEVRIFPVIDLNGQVSRHMHNVIEHFQGIGYETQLVDSNYEFLKGANQYLMIK